MDVLNKKNLQEVTDYKVMNIKECLEALNWIYNESENRYIDISCPCGGEIEFSGYVGTERAECQSCGKHMVNLFSPIQTSSSGATILNPKEYEIIESRMWIAIDGNGGIKEVS